MAERISGFSLVSGKTNCRPIASAAIACAAFVGARKDRFLGME
jgi:hypothetical protein